MNLDRFLEINPPYISLVLSVQEGLLAFLSNVENKVIEVNGIRCDNVENLFREFAVALQFPEYFGHNWAAFDECINDLAWMPANAYILLISNINHVLVNYDNDYRILIRILLKAIKEWNSGRNFDNFPTPPTPFHIVFQCSQDKENEVRNRLARCGLEDIELITL